MFWLFCALRRVLTIDLGMAAPLKALQAVMESPAPDVQAQEIAEMTETPLNSPADLFWGNTCPPGNPVLYDFRLGPVLLSSGMGQACSARAHDFALIYLDPARFPEGFGQLTNVCTLQR